MLGIYRLFVSLLKIVGQLKGIVVRIPIFLSILQGISRRNNVAK